MLETTENAITYRAGEGQSVFPIPFPFLETSHIRARIVGADGSRRELTAGVDYTVNRMSEDNGELVLLGEAPAGGERLRIARLVPLTQEIPFGEHGDDFPRAVEEAVDKLTMIAQQLRGGMEDCPAPDGATNAAPDAVPTPAAERGALPEGGSAGDILSRDTDAAGVWKGPAHIANVLPLMTESQKGVARLARGAGLELDAGGSLRIAADSLVSKANIEGRLGGLDARVEALGSRLDATAAAILALRGRLAEPGTMAGMDDAPANGKAYLRRDRGWREFVPDGGDGSGEPAQGSAALPGSVPGQCAGFSAPPSPAVTEPAPPPPARVYVTASGIYHGECCRHTGAAGEWLAPGSALASGRKLRPCSRCRPGALEG